ncbi:DUF1059 domain-containing protein [Haloferax prahovense]|uniref:DUF1059 domain-containing protein n=1 Tax=Haloferax prahovense TaxID=381852 RepID=UPI001FD17BA5|nr:DUF1059 domain-containing protein [Haloferax prahovense]
MSCLCECGTTIRGESPEDVGTLVTEHMDDAHNMPVDPLEVSEFAIEVNEPKRAAPALSF